VQEAILTSFTFFTQFSGSAILLGRRDPTRFLGHETKAKTGVAPAQRGVLPVPKLSAVRSATSCCLDTCAKTVVTPTVMYMVTWAFCVAVTGPRPGGIESVRRQRHPY
jgi:hypothetical protein